MPDTSPYPRPCSADSSHLGRCTWLRFSAKKNMDYTEGNLWENSLIIFPVFFYCFFYSFKALISKLSSSNNDRYLYVYKHKKTNQRCFNVGLCQH